ncbi:MAG: hypothetical protein JW891_14885 [Candidatus Lokiarchaeota archaeon]|nr:hypothetical protein [Candidatus Lokiarchaeota archaeon]
MDVIALGSMNYIIVVHNSLYFFAIFNVIGLVFAIIGIVMHIKAKEEDTYWFQVLVKYISIMGIILNIIGLGLTCLYIATAL